MKILVGIFLMLNIFSCGLSDEEKEVRTCHYPHKYGNLHLFKIPYTITPHQLTYKVGDTITITANFSNKIEDISYERIFDIDSMLLRPVITFYRFFDNGSWEKLSGQNNIIIDTINNPYYGNSFHSDIVFRDKTYYWNAKIILHKKGRYVFVIGDTSTNSEDEHSLFMQSLNFEGSCIFQGATIGNMIQGDAHLKELEPELIYIDKELTFDNMNSLYDKNSTGVYGSGSYAWELSGTYGFIVE